MYTPKKNCYLLFEKRKLRKKMFQSTEKQENNQHTGNVNQTNKADKHTKYTHNTNKKKL